MIRQVNVETQRLTLRPFELSDAKTVQELAGDLSVSDTTLNIPHPYKDGMAEEWISTHKPRFESGEEIVYAIVLKSSNALIGAIGLTIDKRFNRSELGYWIGKNFWHKGYCTEASKALIEHAFIHFNFHKIIATHITRNPASGRVMQKIGMKLEGTLKEHVIKWDRYEDINTYGILKSAWERMKEQSESL